MRDFFYFWSSDANIRMTNKSDIREFMKRKRGNLSKEEFRERSSAIMENLLSLPEFFRCDVVHTYISSKNNEVDTHDIIRLLVKQKKRVVVPIADPATKMMKHSEIFSLSELVGGAHGILVPKMYRPVPVHELQAVIVPALAVDREGNRLGFGAGYYDRFLHDVQLPSIALAFDFQLTNRLPVEATDVPVSFVVTESSIIRIPSR